MASSMDISGLPNVMDLRSRSSQMLGVSIAFLVPVWVSIALRIYVRVCLAKAFGWDDGIMILAAMSFTSFAALLIVIAEYGYNKTVVEAYTTSDFIGIFNVLTTALEYPEGEIVEYAISDDNLQRTTSAELRHQDAIKNMDDEFLSDYRKAAEVHRQVRQYVQTIAKPGVTMSQLADEIEEGVRALVDHQGLETGDALKAGMGFPTGLCLNNIGAHWTPNPGAKEVVLQYDDVLKVDFGVHVNGRIVDSAFTVASNPVYDNLLTAVKEATNTGLKEADIDARIDQISGDVQEVMESYEVELNGKTIPVKAVQNITGHNILRYKIHGDKQVPFVKTETNQRMEEGDIFAIETFGTTGNGYLTDDIGIYGYGRNEHVRPTGLQYASAKSLLKTIDDNFGTLVFSRRYLERLGVKNYHLGMKSLIASGVVEDYAPLVDIPGSYIAQFEHTVLLRPNCKEVVSRGDDY